MTDRVRFEATAAMPPGDIVAAHDGQFVVRRGKLFEAGEYPDKRFAITPQEQREAAARFAPFDLKDTHAESVFNGKLGTVGEVWTSEDGSELFGTVVIPKWMDTLFTDETLPLSTEWDSRTKDLTGLVLVPTPRVSDAALLAAFSTDFASKRHSAADQSQVQAIHDAACVLGAECAGNGTTNMAGARHSGMDMELVQQVHDTAHALGAECSKKGTAQMAAEAKAPTRFEKFMAWLGGEGTDDTAFGESGRAAAGGERHATFSATDDPTVKALQAEVATLKADKVRMLAEAFADEFIVTKRSALPAERDGMLATFSQAYADDEAHPAVVFFGKNDDGTDRTGSRVAALRAMYEARPRHLLTEELLRDNPTLNQDELRVVFAAGSAPADATRPTPEGKQPSAERIARLKSHIPGITD